MKKVVLLRHGESSWNKENRFTGWTDVDLSEKGVQEAHEAGQTLKKEGYVFDVAFTSVLKRAIRTLWLSLDELDLMWIPVHHSWRLNERHYGALQGLNKSETAAKFGEAQVKIWRRSYDVPPPALEAGDPRYPGSDPRYQDLTADELPRCDSILCRDCLVHLSFANIALPALLAPDHRASHTVWPTRSDRRARQQPARAGQVFGRRLRAGHRRAEHPHRYAAGV